MKKLMALVLGLAAGVAGAEIVVPEGCVSLAPGLTKGVSGVNVSTGVGYLFDGAGDNYMRANAPNPSIGYIPTAKLSFFTTSPVVNAYAISSWCNTKGTYTPTCGPKAWTLYGAKKADDKDWVVLHEVANFTGWNNAPGTEQICWFTFTNTVQYACYKIEFTANCGHKYLQITEFALYHAKDTEAFEVVADGVNCEVGAAQPGYCGKTGCKEGDEIVVDIDDAVCVDSTTGERYELSGWDITDYAGTVLASGTGKGNLPYTFLHRGDFARLTWHWVNMNAAVRTARHTDLTVPNNANVNQITWDGANQYSSHKWTEAFDDNSNTRWAVNPISADTDHWVQYRFLNETPVVTGMRVSFSVSPSTYRLEASKTGEDGSWATLYSGTPSGAAFFGKPAASAANDFENAEPYAYYRFHMFGTVAKMGVSELELYSWRQADTLDIGGAPAAYGRPTPNYGLLTGLAKDEQVACAAPSGQVYASDDVRSACSGYVLQSAGEAPVTNRTLSFAYVHPGVYTRLTWLWDAEYVQTFAVQGAGTVDVSEVWAGAGSEVRVTATPTGDDTQFAYWTGDVPEGCARMNPLVYAADCPRRMTAVFSAPLYAKPADEGGDDAKEGTSWETALASPVTAFQRGTARINLAPGTYVIPGDALVFENGVQLIGSSDPAATVLTVDPERAGTVLRLKDAAALVRGVTLEGGVSSDGYAAGLVLEAGVATNVIVRNCRSTAAASLGGGVYVGETAFFGDSVVSNNVSAGDGGGVCSGCVRPLAGLRLEKNTASANGGGLAIEAVAVGERRTVSNCTFVANRANGASGGGGICVSALSDISDCVFARNSTAGGGGALLFNAKGSYQLSDSVLTNNTASARGGGVEAGTASVKVRRCLVANNASGNRGGGISFYGTATGGLVENCIVTNNVASGASQPDGGGLSVDYCTVRNCLVAGNVSGHNGGGIYCHAGDVVLDNVTVTRNRSTGKEHYAQGVSSQANSFTMRNAIVWGNVRTTGVSTNLLGGGTFSACCVGDASFAARATCFTNDPKFVEGGYALRRGSPCVNKGMNAVVPSGALDLDGNPRIFNFGRKSGIVDLGCYESPWGTPGLLLLVK